MKKQLVLIAALLVGGQIAAKTAVEDLKEFHDMVNRQHADWFNLKKINAERKLELLKEQHSDWTNFGNTQMEKFWHQTSWTPAAKETLFREKLHDAIKLYKEHMASWEKFAENKHKQAQDLCNKHKQELEKFEAQLEPSKTHKRMRSEEPREKHKKMKKTVEAPEEMIASEEEPEEEME